jgi:SAM-dependent methyltransferase
MMREGAGSCGSPDYSDLYDPDSDFDAWYTRATAAVIRRELRPGDRVLELGCATGLMTSLLVPAGVSIVAVERSARYFERARARGLAGATFIQAQLASFAPDSQFDHVVATNVLHELDEPGRLLQRIAGWLVPHGRLHVTVPNARSLHRLAAVTQGLIEDVETLSDRGKQLGTVRVWRSEDLAALAGHNGLALLFEGGIALKPYPNATMAALPPDVLDGLARAAELLPRNAAMSYLAFRPAGDAT